MEAEKKISSLDYLLDDQPTPTAKGSDSDESATAPPAVLQAFASVQVLQVAREFEAAAGSNHPGVLLSDIDSRLKLGALALVPSVRLLVEAGLMEVIESRAFDDHRVTVTDEAVTLLEPDRQPELLRRLGAA